MNAAMGPDLALVGVLGLILGLYVLTKIFPSNSTQEKKKALKMIKDSLIDFNKPTKVFIYLESIGRSEDSGLLGFYRIRNNGYRITFCIPLSSFHEKGWLETNFPKNQEVILSEVLDHFHSIEKDNEEVYLYVSNSVKEEILKV